MQPLLYACQFCRTDKLQAMGLARLIADLQPEPTEEMGFMFCPKGETFVDAAVFEHVKAKFHYTCIYQCTTRIENWPRGPNAQVHEIYQKFYSMTHASRDPWDYCAILMGEPDCVPLARDWWQKLQWEWHNCDWNWPLGNRQHVLGCWLTGDDSTCGAPHINGNCILGKNFGDVYPAFKAGTNHGAWDTTHSAAMMAHGRPSKFIYSAYRLDTPEEPIAECEILWQPRMMHGSNPIANVPLSTVYLHGCKSMRAQQCVRDKFGLGPAMNTPPNRAHPFQAPRRT
jgi:hypothetical protein